MATRFYFPSMSWQPAPISPAIHPTWSGERPDFSRARPWSNAPSEVLARPNLANSDGLGASFSSFGNPSQECGFQFVWGPIQAISLANQAVSVGFMGHHGSTWGFHWLQACAWIATPAGAVRGVISTADNAATFSGSNSYPSNTPYSSRFASGTTVNGSFSALAGDFVVIEVGFENQSGATMNSFLQLGDGNASDITVTESTTNRNPFFEFASNFVLLSTAGTNNNQLMMTGVGT